MSSAVYIVSDMALLGAAILLFAGYLVLLLRDVIAIGRQLEQAGFSSNTHLVSGRSEADGARRLLLTSSGRRLRERLEAVRYRMNSLEWQVDALHEARRSPARPKELGAIRNDSPLSSYSGVCAALLDENVPRFRADIAAVILSGATNAPAVVAYGGKGARFNEALGRFVTPFFVSGERSALGIRDARLHVPQLAELTYFGVTHTLAVPLEWLDAAAPKRGVIVFAYQSPHQPTALEERWAADIASELELRLAASAHLRQAEAASNEKSEFIAHVSHDLRSPLNNIQGVLQILRLENKNEEHGELVEVALSNCTAMRDQLESMLDFSKLRAGKLSARQEAVDLNGLLEEVVNNYRVAAKLKNLDLLLCVDSTPEPLAWIDPQLVRRIVSNLISNGIKFTERGSVVVGLALEGVDADQQWRISVTDTGVGLDESEIAKLFTPFTRLQERRVEGIGLGLVLCKVLAELNSGTIAVRSVKGQGTTFSLVLPRLQCHRAPARPRVVVPDLVVPARQQQSILLVDDDPECVSTLARVLGRHGYQVAKAGSVKEAIAVLTFDPPALVVSDVRMPDGGAKALLQHMSRARLEIPLIVLSGLADGQARTELLACGATCVLEKPVLHDTLLERISEILVPAIAHHADVA